MVPTPGARPGSRRAELVDLRELARLVGFPLLAPARDVAGEEAVGLAEVAEPHRVVVGAVQAREHVDQLVRHATGVVEAEARELVDRSDTRPSTRSIT